MEKKIIKLRDCVGIILARKDGKVWTGKRKLGMGVRIGEKNLWQMPQGGVDKNENFLNAASRELKEETSVKSTKLIKEIDNWLTYDLPNNLLGKIWKGKYRGQKQKWFIMRFIGNDKEINVKTKNAEFKEWKWIDTNQLTNVAVSFKLEVYKSILKELKILLN